jgi:hypothetical protein
MACLRPQEFPTCGTHMPSSTSLHTLVHTVWASHGGASRDARSRILWCLAPLYSTRYASCESLVYAVTHLDAVVARVEDGD